MFKRRTPHHPLRHARELLWPSMGWRRTFDYYKHRIFRNGNSTYRVTAGLATGIAVSFTPFLGTHLIQAAFFSWLFRASILSGLAGTIAGNPWTFPVMLWLDYKLGLWLCIPFRIPVTEGPLHVALPLAVGGYACAVLCWPVAYLMLYHPVRAARKAYDLNRLERRDAVKSRKENEV